VNTIGFASTCAATCGTGSIDAGESCDDDNVVNGDGCGDDCQIEAGY
jgi:cysteine-rich repeat protein